MNPVYERLLEIAHDQGLNDPVPGTYFQELLDLSSGRISQISDQFSVAKLGTKGLNRLAKMGYNPEWVNDGKLPKRLFTFGSDDSTQGQGTKVSSFSGFRKKTQRQKDIEEINKALEDTRDDGVALILGEALRVAKERPIIRKQAK